MCVCVCVCLCVFVCMCVCGDDMYIIIVIEMGWEIYNST